MYEILVPIILFILLIFYALWPKTVDIDLKNRHVLITGGSSGIGKSAAIEAARLGAHVTIIARYVGRLEMARTEIKTACISKSQKISIYPVDVTDVVEIEKFLVALDGELPIYMLITCAGKAVCGKIEDITVKETINLMNLNFMGTYYFTRTLIPRMKRRKEGIIVMTASQAALMGIYGMGAYSATKFAVRGFAEAIDMEVRPYNMSVTLVLPPDTDTPGFKKENEFKPTETMLISKSGGLWHPKTVAQRMLQDAIQKKFYSCVGLESFIMSTLCCGMSPFRSWTEPFVQLLFIGPFRILGLVFLAHFHKITDECKKRRGF